MPDQLQELLNSARPSNDDVPLRVVDMDDDEAVGIFETLGSETTYLIYKQLHEEPNLPRELASTLDSSIQNVHYHLNKLEEANLIEPVDTWHSQNGVEMQVYAPVHTPLILSFASEDEQKEIQSLLSHTFGLLGLVGLVSVLSEFLVTWWIASGWIELDRIAGSGSGSGSTGEADTLFDNLIIDTFLSAPGLTLFLFGVALVSAYTAYRVPRKAPPWR